MSWPVGEAARNVWSGTTHTLRYVLALTAVVGVALAADISGADAVLGKGAQFRESGAAVLTVEAPGRIDGTTCDSFATLPGVRAAGALRQASAPLVAAALPRGPIAAHLVSPGAPAVFQVDDAGSAGVLLATDAADDLGVLPGGTLVLDGTATSVRGTYPWPQDGRRSGYGYAALIPADRTEPYDACWIDAYPVPSGLLAVAQMAVLPDGTDRGGAVAVSQLNTTLGSTFDGATSYASRATRYAVWTSYVGGAVLGFVAVYARRLEFAAAQHVGVRASRQHLQVLAEATALVIPASLILGAIAAILIRTGGGEDPAALVRVAVYVVAPGLATTVLGTQAAVALIREEHLFRYFRTR